MGSFVPLMENGGNGEHFPWNYDMETVQIYRRYVNFHTELIPFFLTAGSNALENKRSVMKPLNRRQYYLTL